MSWKQARRRREVRGEGGSQRGSSSSNRPRGGSGGSKRVSLSLFPSAPRRRKREQPSRSSEAPLFPSFPLHVPASVAIFSLVQKNRIDLLYASRALRKKRKVPTEPERRAKSCRALEREGKGDWAPMVNSSFLSVFLSLSFSQRSASTHTLSSRNAPAPPRSPRSRCRRTWLVVREEKRRGEAFLVFTRKRFFFVFDDDVL